MPNKKKTNSRKSTGKSRKDVPLLSSSQASLGPSTPTTSGNQTDDIKIQLQNAAQHGTYVPPKDENTAYKNKYDQTCNFFHAVKNTWWFLILIGTVIGVFVMYCNCRLGWVPAICNGNGRAKPLHDYIYVSHNGSCPCDVTTNKTCIECKECMDKYWIKHRNCKNNKNKLEGEINTLKNDIKELKRTINNARKRCDDIENELNECKKNNMKLRKELNGTKEEMCVEYIEQIGELKHELGECNVEWDTCELKGRQKDKLDEKRVEEIQKQKKKFELCNEQLKRYKNEAKKNRGKK